MGQALRVARRRRVTSEGPANRSADFQLSLHLSTTNSTLDLRSNQIIKVASDRQATPPQLQRRGQISPLIVRCCLLSLSESRLAAMPRCRTAGRRFLFSLQQTCQFPTLFPTTPPTTPTMDPGRFPPNPSTSPDHPPLPSAKTANARQALPARRIAVTTRHEAMTTQ